MIFCVLNLQFCLETPFLHKKSCTAHTGLLLLYLQGYIKYSALFYGYYNNQRTIGWLKYRLPMAYFMVGISVFGYSLMVVIRS